MQFLWVCALLMLSVSGLFARLSLRLSLSAPALKLLSVEWAQNAFEWLFEFVSRYEIITPVARRKNSLILKLFKFIITNEMCTGEFNFGNKQVLIFTQCLLAFLLAQLVLPPPHSLETNKNNTHTHTPATAAAFSQFSSYHFSTLLTLQHCLNHNNNNKSKPNNNSKNNNIFKLWSVARVFFSVFQFFLLFMFYTRARENNNKRR